MREAVILTCNQVAQSVGARSVLRLAVGQGQTEPSKPLAQRRQQLIVAATLAGMSAFDPKRTSSPFWPLPVCWSDPLRYFVSKLGDE
jgi:hypothetical protein